MSKASGISRSDWRRNARREHLRELLPRDGAVLGIDLGDAKQALALALVDHDMRVLWRRSPRCAAHQLGGPIGEAVEATARAGMSRLTVAWPSAVTAAGDPFKSLTWLAALEVATSRCGGDPARLAAAGEEEFLALVRDAAPGWGMPRPDRRIARKVLALADDPGAVGWSRRGLFRRIRDELGDLQRARRQLKEAEADMAALLAALGLGRLGDIPGLTLVGAAVILAETGDPAATRPLLPWSSTPGCRRRTTRRGHARAPHGSRGAAGPRCASRPGGRRSRC